MGIEQHLQDYIDNNKCRISGLQDEIDKLAYSEEYESAEKIKHIKNEVQNSTYRLERILQGLPAFDEPENTTNTQKEIKA